jgi:hypothetical protein
MGTNYYRIPSVEEMEDRRETLLKQIQSIQIDPSSISSNFRTRVKMDDYSEGMNPWERFIDDIEIHLGKRSGGWKFLWNFHSKRYYSDKEELLAFIRSGRVVNEYGEEIDVEEFITMALEWEQPDGYDTQTYTAKYPHEGINWMNIKDYCDNYIDGLRVSSSTDFC